MRRDKIITSPARLGEMEVVSGAVHHPGGQRFLFDMLAFVASLFTTTYW
jgi:hypothetical protein